MYFLYNSKIYFVPSHEKMGILKFWLIVWNGIYNVG